MDIQGTIGIGPWIFQNLYYQSESKLSGLWKSIGLSCQSGTWQFHCLTRVSQVKLEGILSHTTYPDKVMWCGVLCCVTAPGSYCCISVSQTSLCLFILFVTYDDVNLELDLVYFIHSQVSQSSIICCYVILL